LICPEYNTICAVSMPGQATKVKNIWAFSFMFYGWFFKAGFEK